MLLGVSMAVENSKVGPIEEMAQSWQDEIEGPLHSVRFTHRKMIAPGEWRNVVGEFTLH